MTATLLVACLVVTASVADPAGAGVPDGVSGPVIYHEGTWYIRTTPTTGPANLTFSYGRRGALADLPVVGDWDGNGSETVGIARITGEFPQVFRWHLRNRNSSGPADVTFEFGIPRATDYLRGLPVVGNFDPADDAYEVGYVTADSGGLTWTIRRDTTPTSPEVTFRYGRADDRPLVGDWDGDGVDTPGALRNQPPTDVGGGYEKWLVTNRNATGTADARFTYGSDAFALRNHQQSDLFYLPRLAIEVT